MELDIQQRFEGLETQIRDLKTDVEGLKGDVKLQMRQMEDRFSEQIRDMQTELLKAFLPWQQQARIEFRELEANTGNS